MQETSYDKDQKIMETKVIQYGDACRNIGITKMADQWSFTTDHEEMSEDSSIYFKTIGVSDKNGVPYTVFYSTNTQITPISYMVADNGSRYRLISSLDKCLLKIPLVEEGVDYEVILEGHTGDITLLEDVLKDGLFEVVFPHEDYKLTIDRNNIITIK